MQAGLDLAVRVEAAARAAFPGGAISLAAIKTRQTRERVNDAMAAIGADLKERRGQYTVALRTGRRDRDLHTFLKALGLDAADAVARLNKGERVAIEVPAESLPLALTPATWSQAVFDRLIAPRALFAEILRTPDALLFWHGVMSMDPPTRRFLEASPDLVTTLAREAAPLFSTFSAQVKVREGRVQVAGGAPVQVLWEALVGARVSEPTQFVRRIFTRDNGRLAVFFDLMQRLPPPQRAFAAGLWIPNIDDRLERFRALYSVVSSADTEWKPTLAPLSRRPADPWLLLRSLETRPDSHGNGLAGPQQRGFWKRAFEPGLPEDPARSLRDLDADGVVDAAWLVEQVCLQPAIERGVRMRQVMVVPRSFPAPTATDLPAALMAARGLARFPALFLVLERADLLTPALTVAAARQAEAVDRIDDRDRRAIALAALQGGMALVDRLTSTGAITADVSRSLAAALAAVPLRDESFRAGIAEWLADRVVPALGAPGVRGFDTLVVDALARRSDAKPQVNWEGESYVVDWFAADRDRLAQLRKGQGGYRVDDVVRLVQVVRALQKTVPAPEGMREPARAAAALAKDFERARPLAEIAEPLEVPRLLVEVQRELERVRSARDRERVTRAVDRLTRVAEWATAHVLIALAYTPHLGDPTGSAARAGDFHLRHRFGVHDESDTGRRDDPWRLPNQIDSGGAVTGSLVGLDIALARLSLRRLSTTAVPVPTLLSTPNFEVVAANAVLANPRLMTDSDVTSVALALANGREMVQRATTPAALDVLAESASLSGDRRSVLAWMARHEPDRVLDMFSLGELLVVGGGRAVPDALGTPTLATDGRLRLAWPSAEAWEVYSGRPTLGLMATFAPDLTLRIVELMVQARLPLELLPGVLAFALQDELDSVRLHSSEDWLGLVRFARTLTQERFEDYVSALAGIGILAPAPRERP